MTKKTELKRKRDNQKSLKEILVEQGGEKSYRDFNKCFLQLIHKGKDPIKILENALADHEARQGEF